MIIKHDLNLKLKNLRNYWNFSFIKIHIVDDLASDICVKVENKNNVIIFFYISVFKIPLFNDFVIHHIKVFQINWSTLPSISLLK